MRILRTFREACVLRRPRVSLHGSNGVSRALLLAAVLAGIVATPVPAAAGPLGALVPAYFYPGTGGAGGVGDGWAQMDAAAAQIPITAIFNPNSGPGPSVDPNYVNAITNLEAAGGKVVAYVPTFFSATPLATVEGEINTYISQYGNKIEGFFVDQMTNSSSASDVSYYHSLYSFIKGLNPSYQVIGNPGTNTDPAYLAPSTQGADTLVTFENFASAYASTPPASWVFGESRSHFANIIHTETSIQGMKNDIALAAQRNVGYVYVTDLTLSNPYNALPSYWDQEVAAIQGAVVPEPDGLTALVSGGIFASLAVAARRWNRQRFAARQPA